MIRLLITTSISNTSSRQFITRHVRRNLVNLTLFLLIQHNITVSRRRLNTRRTSTVNTVNRHVNNFNTKHSVHHSFSISTIRNRHITVHLQLLRHTALLVFRLHLLRFNRTLATQHRFRTPTINVRRRQLALLLLLLLILLLLR